MAQRRINTYNVRNPVRESDIYDEVDLPEYNINKKQSEAEPQSPPHLQPSVQQSVPKMKHQNKFSRETKTLFSVAALSFFLLLFIAIILASVLISLLKDTQVRCPDLQSPGNGFIAITAGSYSQFGLGAVANYSCNPGFTLVGRMIRGCRLLSGGEESTGVWNTTKPSCRAIPLCLALESPNNGQLRKISGDNSVDLVVGSIAEFSCNSGYVVAGQERLVCKSFSSGVEWNGKPPTCKLGTLLDCHTTNCRTNELSCIGGGHCRISCNDTSAYACHNSSIVCSEPGDGCTVACNERYSCLQSTIHCPRNGACNMNCQGSQACMRATTECQRGNCDLNCNAEYSCSYLAVTLSSEGKSNRLWR
ncbi:sushi, von Willebrand factor type A, EGF and pentraxin domain-containing protein 1-like [Halichondria panicea]|uniref:sushi, von Willebrand factor type A, EGF and pentraxin domain-containing protein 1-like n=1 Tax=Halichondria panicea TaxID=6063 RepID=UPI00312B3BAD